MPRRTDRCTGHCCENLSLSLSPSELARGYCRWLSSGGGEGEALAMNEAHAAPIYREIYLIAPMLVYLGYTRKHPGRVNPTDEELRGEPPPLLHRYRCKHLDPKTKDCTIYDFRPAMCRDYPYGTGCDYAACTWREQRTKRETAAERRERKRRLTAPPADDAEVVEKPE